MLCLLVKSGLPLSLFICIAADQAEPHAWWANTLLQNSISPKWRLFFICVITSASWVAWPESQGKDKRELPDALDPLHYLSQELHNFSNLSPHRGVGGVEYSYLHH